MDDLDNLIQRLRREAQSQSASRAGTWRRYDDTLAAMSAEQKGWVCKQDSVLRAKSEMYGQFIDYLFEQNKDAFVSVGDGRYKKVCEDYIDIIQASASTYVSRSEQLEKQNEDLAKRNEELQKKIDEFMKGKKDEPMATSGSGRSREGGTSDIIRPGKHTESDSSDPELFEC